MALKQTRSRVGHPPFQWSMVRSFGVLCPNRQQVRKYLEEHPGLSAIVARLCERSRQEFGPQAELSLELYRDPEIEDRYLTLYVRQDSYPVDLIDQIERVSRPFRRPLARLSGHVLLATDFSRPRGSNGV